MAFGTKGSCNRKIVIALSDILRPDHRHGFSKEVIECPDKLKIPSVQKPLRQLLAFGHHELRDAASSQKIIYYGLSNPFNVQWTQ